MLKGTSLHRSRWVVAILLAGLALLASTASALGAEPPAGVALDGTVTVVFHGPGYDEGHGIEGADVSLVVVDPTDPDVIVQEEHGSTDADGVASFTGVARMIDPALELELQVDVVRDRTVVDADGCTVTERLEGIATAVAGLEVTIDVEVQGQQGGRTCPPPIDGPAIVVAGHAVDPDGAPLAIVYGEALLGVDEVALPVETTADGGFSVDVPVSTDPTAERLLTLMLIGPDVRTVEDDEGCLITYTLVARGSWTIVGEETPEPRTLVAEEEPLSGVCGGATATPLAPAPRVTLPPTDTAQHGLVTGDGGFATATLLLIAVSLAAAGAADRRISRRGS
jgi:hypothetical protein